MRRHWWWVLGLVLVVGGVLLALLGGGGGDAYSWIAYTPLSEEPDWQMGWGNSGGMGSAVLTTWWQLAGYAVVAVGVALLAAGAGYRLGRRRAGRDDL